MLIIEYPTTVQGSHILVELNCWKIKGKYENLFQDNNNIRVIPKSMGVYGTEELETDLTFGNI